MLPCSRNNHSHEAMTFCQLVILHNGVQGNTQPCVAFESFISTRSDSLSLQLHTSDV
jgi:hypothetical protein